MKNSLYIFVRLLGLVLALQISQTYAGTNVPVLIWGGDSDSDSSNNLVDPFEKTSQDDFEKIVTRYVGGSLKPVLVFVRDDLCVEDLTKHKDSLGSLTDIGSLIYRPAVDTPVSVFEKLPLYNCTTEDELESVSDGQLVLTKNVDLEGIVKTFNIMRESSPGLVAALTGKSCRYGRSERIKRAIVPVDRDNNTRILLYYSSPPTLTLSEDKNITAELTKGPFEEGNGTDESPLRLNFEYTIKNGTSTYTANVLMQFPVKISGYYSPEVLYKYNDESIVLSTSPSIDVSFPFNFSYHCSQSLTFNNWTVARFNLTDFQVQIDAESFGDAYDCVGFMTVPIWAGIFVVTILAIIMTWGLMMIMDIRTMDRFDDPKGKSITISATVD